MKALKMMTLSAVALFALISCEGWTLDYGEPAAQFHEEAVAAKGADYVGKKITIKGVVTKQDLGDPENCLIHLGHGIVCNFGDMAAMAEGCKVGDTVFVDGILKRCGEGDILLKPALGRDPTASFEPIE